ncbi:unnamed protein product, partial [Brenthis ino]
MKWFTVLVATLAASAVGAAAQRSPNARLVEHSMAGAAPPGARYSDNIVQDALLDVVSQTPSKQSIRSYNVSLRCT